MTYKTSLDKLAKWVTIGVTVLFAIIIFTQLAVIDKKVMAIPIVTIVFFLLIYALVVLYRPISYEVTYEKIIIHRPLKDVSIDRADIKSVELLEKDKTKSAIRTFGVGGMFGYFGKFASPQMGSMTWYATRRDRTVLVKTVNREKIILTPDEPERFVAEVDR